MVSHEYFMKHMQLYEIYDLLDCVPYADKAQWESTRVLAYYIAQKFCKKHLKVTDVLKLPWDNPDGELVLTEEMKKKNEEFQNQMLDFLNKKDTKEENG